MFYREGVKVGTVEIYKKMWNLAGGTKNLLTMIIEFIKHVFGICGDHWHPNVWTVVASRSDSRIYGILYKV